jgi:PAS domain S-box-containing protein
MISTMGLIAEYIHKDIQSVCKEGRPILQLSTGTKHLELLKTSESLLHLLIDSLPAFIGYIDSDQKYVLANRLYKEFFGIKFIEARGLHVKDVIGYQAYQSTRPHIEAALRGQRQSYEYAFVHLGETHYMKADYVPDMEKGQVKGIFVLGIDTTEQKQMEQRLLRSERLAAIGETAAMVGHDLRNPLQAMMGTVYLAKELIDSPKPEDKTKAVALLNSLDEEVDYMNKIVSDLQNFSGPVAAKPVEMDLTNLIMDVLSNLKVPENVETTLDSKNASRITADPLLMKRIIINLVTNAIQAMPNGGKLVISCVSGRNLSVVVRDTGVGMAPEDIAQVFTPFFTKKARGQGLGLAVCKRLVEAQGGTITLESKLGYGSTFTVTIPTPTSEIR